MAYAPIPFSPAETYSNRDYTLKQIELLQQQADRESAYAQQRGALMADRWQGLGGVTTETLADLVKSRDLRQAKALEQRRYDSEQGRLNRAESDRTRAFNAETARDTREDEWRRSQADKADRIRQYGQLMERDPSIPFTDEEKRLYDEFNPTSLNKNQPRQATVVPPSDESISPVTFGGAMQSPQRGVDAMFGRVNFGGPSQTLADVSRRQPVIAASPVTAPAPTGFLRPLSAAEARDKQTLVRAEELRKEAVRYRDEQDALQLVKDKKSQDNVDRQFAQSSSNQNLIRSAEDRVVREKAESLTQQIEMVLKNPSSFVNLPLATQAAIGPALSNRGFTGFGKPMSDAALTSIAQSNSAMKGLEDLRVLVFDHKDQLGPLAGMASLIPYSDARKIQSDLNLSKQRVGKLLEGGVLRKEDEVKYAQILATLYDTPELALYKIDGMMRNLERDLKAFSDAQLMGGRRPMNPPPGTPPPPPVPDLRAITDAMRNKTVPLGRVLPGF